MRQHDRYKLEAKARVKIDQLMRDMGLTEGEQVRVLSRLLSDAGKYIVRHERHGDYSTPADEAHDRPDHGEQERWTDEIERHLEWLAGQIEGAEQVDFVGVPDEIRDRLADRLRGAPEGAGEGRAGEARGGGAPTQARAPASEVSLQPLVDLVFDAIHGDADPRSGEQAFNEVLRRLRTGREGLPEDVLMWAWSEAMGAFYASHRSMSGPYGRSHHYDDEALRRWRAISEELGGWHERDFWRRIDLAEGLEREDVSGTGREERDDG